MSAQLNQCQQFIFRLYFFQKINLSSFVLTNSVNFVYFWYCLRTIFFSLYMYLYNWQERKIFEYFRRAIVNPVTDNRIFTVIAAFTFLCVRFHKYSLNALFSWLFCYIWHMCLIKWVMLSQKSRIHCAFECLLQI